MFYQFEKNSGLKKNYFQNFVHERAITRKGKDFERN